MALEQLVYHLDPRNDIKSFERLDEKKSWLYTLKSYGLYLLGTPKHILRGAVTGGTLGALVGTVGYGLAGENISEGALVGALYGAAFGMVIDGVQFAVRSSKYLQDNLNNQAGVYTVEIETVGPIQVYVERLMQYGASHQALINPSVTVEGEYLTANKTNYLVVGRSDAEARERADAIAKELLGLGFVTKTDVSKNINQKE